MRRRNAALRLLGLSVGSAVLPAAVALAMFGHRVTSVKETVWAIGIYTGPSPCVLAPAAGVANPVLTAGDVTDVKADFVADPFMVRHDSTWHMFFEVMNALTGQGDIGLALSPDGLTWRYDRIVLDEPFHLSYPCTFAWEDDHFMVPESHRDGTVRLYRARDFPYGWTVEDTLLHGKYVDPTVCRHGGMWWLFVCSPSHDTLRLFGAAALHDEWREHPAGPIVKGDPNRAQPAGRFVHWRGGIVRYAHDDEPTYGKMVRAFLIEELAADGYRESAVREPVLGPAPRGWNRHGMHHLDPHPVPGGGGWIACVDGYKKYFTVRIEY